MLAWPSYSGQVTEGERAGDEWVSFEGVWEAPRTPCAQKLSPKRSTLAGSALTKPPPKLKGARLRARVRPQPNEWKGCSTL
jgi:hypothetical protein